MKKSPQSWQDVKSTIKELPANALLQIIADLYHLSKENQHFLHARYLHTPDTLDSYKAIIRKALHPDIERSNEDVSLSAGRKAIRDFKKASGEIQGLLDLMIYYVECGNDFTLKYGDIDEPFYNSLVTMFSDVIVHLKREQNAALTTLFLPRLQRIVHSAHGIGWGYYDDIAHSLAEFERERDDQ